jgi:putative transposase
MGRRRFVAEKIIWMLRESEVLLAQGKKVGEVCRSLVISEQSYYRWRREYGGLKDSQAKWIRELEPQNSHLKKDGVDFIWINRPGAKRWRELLRPLRRRHSLNRF